MTPKIKKPDPPKIPVSAADMLPTNAPDDTSKAYSSLINTSPMGLQRKASTAKKSLLGGS